MNKKATNIVYIGGSLLLVVAAIAITTILNRTSNPKPSEDIRAKAGATSTLQVTGVVSTVNASTETLTVDQVKFASSETADNLGLWTVSAPQIDLSTLAVGSTVTMTIDAGTFLINARTMTATQIKIAK